MLKRVELWGRRLLVGVLGGLLGRPSRPIALDVTAPVRLLVVRLDERVGNVILTTPLLVSLRQRFPAAVITLLGNARVRGLIASHPAIDRFVPFRKRALFAADGPLGTPLALRRARFDVAIDAGNPTDPSVTAALLVRVSGAAHSVGADSCGFGRLYSAPVSVTERGPSEIAMRGALLDALPGNGEQSTPSLPHLLPANAASESDGEGGAYAIVHAGARLRGKRLSAMDYGRLAALVHETGLRALVTFGPGEEHLAAAAAHGCDAAELAPPTDLPALARWIAGAVAVLSCDTGPMHLAVALGRPTCGVFVATDPARYGHADPPHLVIDARHGGGLADHLPAAGEWLRRTRGSAGLPAVVLGAAPPPLSGTFAPA